jgi:hypothetical protein
VWDLQMRLHGELLRVLKNAELQKSLPYIPHIADVIFH